MKPSFFDEYGRGVTIPVNAIAYELTDGGDLVRGKPHTWAALESHVWQAVQRYRDLSHFTRGKVKRELNTWLRNNETKG